MAVTEKSGFLKYKDAAGNTTLMYPITTKDNVDGMDEIDAHIASTDNPHNVTVDQIGAISYSAQSLSDEQKIQARANIGVGTPDWNENDPSASGYIANRPFYSYVGQGALIDNVSITTDDGYGELAIGGIALDAGQNYTVIFNGETYECVARYWSDEDTVLLGNGTIYGDGDSGNGEPFSCDNYSDGSMYLNVSTDGDYTISIIGFTETVNKLDKKYLPEDALIGIKGTGIDAEVFNGGTSEQASGRRSHAEGQNTTASGYASHAEGSGTTASEQAAHAEGSGTTASDIYAHAEGHNTTASGEASHAEGTSTVASSHSAHAEGGNTEANREYSHAEGYYTIASGLYQHVQGKYNVANSGTYAHIVGNGTSDAARSNAHTLDWNGNAWFAGTVEGTGLTVNGDANVVGVLKVNGKQAFYYATGTSSQTIGTANATGGTTICCGSSANTTIQGANVKANNILPSSSNTYTLGSTTYRWKEIYSNTAVNVSSDERLKRDISTVDNEALAKFIEGLNVVSYNYNDDAEDEQTRIGLIAQNVQEANADIAKFFVSEDEEGMLNLKPADLVFPLIAAVQRLSARVEELEANK